MYLVTRPSPLCFIMSSVETAKISHELSPVSFSNYLLISEKRLHESCVYNEQCSHRDINSFCFHRRRQSKGGETTETNAAARAPAAAAIEARCLCKHGFHATRDIAGSEFGAEVCLIGETVNTLCEKESRLNLIAPCNVPSCARADGNLAESGGYVVDM